MQNNDGLTSGQKIFEYFTQLEFYRSEQALGDESKKTVWTIVVYLLSSLGIFCRQITDFPKVDINFQNVHWGILFASFIFGFALLPYIIRQLNKRKTKPSFEHIASAFGIGFFIDFASNGVIHYYFMKP